MALLYKMYELINLKEKLVNIVGGGPTVGINFFKILLYVYLGLIFFYNVTFSITISYAALILILSISFFIT